MNEAFPTITIGLCVKNNERTIRTVINSIINLEYPRNKLFIVVVDGLSKDKTLDIIRSSLEKTNIEYKILCDNGKGIAYARQLVIKNAKGEYVLWVDGDNVLIPSYLRETVTKIVCNKRIGVVYPQVKLLVTNRSNAIERLQYYYSRLYASSVKKGGAPIALAIQGTLCRIEAINDVGGFDITLPSGEDIDLFIRMSKRGWSFVRAGVVYHFPKHRWSEVVRQAIWWNRGRYIVSKKHNDVGLDPLWSKPHTTVFLDAIKVLFLTLKGIKLFKDYAVMLLPLYFLIRRLGFLAGYVTSKLEFK